MELDTTTALTVILPKENWDKVNSIRKNHDKAYSRWMPHVNLLFPFVPQEKFEEYYEKLQKVLSGFGPIPLYFNKIGYFEQKNQVTVNLQLSDDSKLQELFELIRNSIPEVKPKHPEFHPHLTLGQFDKNILDQKMVELDNWLGLGLYANIDQIYIINRSKKDNMPFSINRVINLK